VGRLFDSQLTEYADLGFDALPLAPGTKVAIVKDWQHRAPDEMWRDAPTDSNIGLRCGGELSLAVLDADDDDNPETSRNLARFLAGLGIDPGDCPVVSTPNGGRHFYLSLAGELPGNVRLLAPSIGAGELRFGNGAYVGAPPSVIDGRAYRLAEGDFRSLEQVDVRDVLPILANQDATPATTDAPALPTDAPTISRKAWRLLKGGDVDRYHSRSEIEQAIIASLIATGHDFNSVLGLFLMYPCAGKFRELSAKNPSRATKWLRHSFEQAQRFVGTHSGGGRQHADAAIAWALSRTWQGRTGATDRAVFIAHATIAQRSGAMEYAASCRTVAEMAQVNFMTATRATHRLMDADLLALVKPATAFFANVYRLNMSNIDTPNDPFVMKCIKMKQATHDAFRARGFGHTFKARGLGKAASLVFGELQRGEPLTIAQLAERTGRARQTVWRVLNRMARIVDRDTGEILAMVERDAAGKWLAREDVDLDRVARALGTFGGGAWQKKRHNEERRAHREQLAHKQSPGEQRLSQ
jgi:hypothetical protein